MDINKENPFAYAWLNSSYHETLFSSTPWQNVYFIICFTTILNHKLFSFQLQR